MQIIKATGIQKSYGELQVLKGIDFSIEQGEIVAIVGPSGAGKTTLLQILGTLDKAQKGSLEISGTDITTLNDKEISKLRNRKIGFVFQFHHLLPEFTALENVCMPAFIAGKAKSATLTEAKKFLGYLGLDDRLDHKPNELSGGEQQRVAVARALINKPDIILADEPSGNLDSNNAKELHSLFLSLRDELMQTFLIVTHNPELAGMADRTLEMKDGRWSNELRFKI